MTQKKKLYKYDFFSFTPYCAAVKRLVDHEKVRAIGLRSTAAPLRRAVLCAPDRVASAQHSNNVLLSDGPTNTWIEWNPTQDQTSLMESDDETYLDFLHGRPDIYTIPNSIIIYTYTLSEFQINYLW